jgi:hypothetical protein
MSKVPFFFHDPMLETVQSESFDRQGCPPLNDQL